MNILVTGGEGQLGYEVHEASSTSSDCYFFTDVQDLDICDYSKIETFCLKKDIDIIINCAAYTNVDLAESNGDLANRINHIAVDNLAKVAKKRSIYLFHISTDYVFGGVKNTPMREDDKINPLGVYGKTKRLGEEAIFESGCKYLIFRTAWLYSWRAKNFVKTMLNLTSSKEEIKVVFDQVGTPTNAADLARTIIQIISERLYQGNEGVYHFSNEGVCSWFDFAWEINVIAGHSCRVLPCYSSEFPSPVERPAYSVLDKTKIKNTFHIEVPYWKKSLVSCIDRIRKNENI